MRSTRWITLSLCLTVGIFLADYSWGAVGKRPDLKAFPHQTFGPSHLSNQKSASAAAPDPLAQDAWNRLKSDKGAEDAVVEWSSGTGLPHSVAYLKRETPGGTLESKALGFLKEYSDLFLKSEATGSLEVEQIDRGSFGSGHVVLRQKLDGLRVLGGTLAVHFDSDDHIVMVNGDYIPDLKDKIEKSERTALSPEAAYAKGLKAYGRFGSTFKTISPGEEVIYAKNPHKGGVYRAYLYTAVGYALDAQNQFVVDAFSGELLAVFPLVAYLDGTASIYDPNQAQSGLVNRTLTDLDDSGFLRGPLMNVLDEENPRAQSASRQFNFAPNTPSFRQASIYYYVTETRKRLRALGFNDQAAGDLPAIANALDKTNGGEFNNAFYSGLSKGFVFGNGDGSVFQNLSIDFDVAAHEFGHFFDDALINTESTPLHSPRRSWGEAAGDTVAAIINGDPNVGESSVPGELFLRTIDNTKRFPNDVVNEEHLDGEIYGGANWDFMKLRGGGSVALAEREEMARVMIAGIPFIAPANVQFNDILKGFVQGDMTRGGANVDNLRAAYDMHGISEGGISKAWEESGKALEAKPESTDKLLGFSELQSGIPVFGTLGEGFFVNFYIRVPPGATSLTVQTFIPGVSQQGDVTLAVAPSNYQGLQDIYFSDFGFINETIVVNQASNPLLSRDSLWLVEVRDFIDGTFSEVGVVATVEGGQAQITQVFPNNPVNGRIDNVNDFDKYYFSGQAGQSVDIAVNTAGDQQFDPLLLLGNSLGELIAFDDNSGGGPNALLKNFILPFTDNYLIGVQSAVTAQGPTTFGNYQLILSPGGAPLPTPTPLAPPDPNGITTLTLGVPFNGDAPGNEGGQGAGVSQPFKVTVPEGARELVITARQVPTPGGTLILQVRKGQPVGNTLDDYVGLGGRKTTVVVTPNTRVPLTPGDYFMLLFNLAESAVPFEIAAFVDAGEGTPNYDLVDDGKIDALDLLAMIRQNPANRNTFFDFAQFWKGTP